MNGKRIILRLRSNLNRYTLNIYDDYGRCYKTITRQNDCVCVCAKSRYLRVFASPLSSEYYNEPFYKLDACRNDLFNLSFIFQKRVDTENLYTFYLTDETYGLKIDGNLYFSQ